MKEKILVALAQVLFILALVSFLLPVQAQITQPGTPAGAILYFSATACPSGWTEYTTARGLYIVGRVSGGTLATAVGTVLTNQENRAVGQHTHTVTDPGHGHGLQQEGGAGASTALTGASINGAATIVASNANTGAATTGVTIQNSGSVVGTNAPYLQLLVCQKS